MYLSPSTWQALGLSVGAGYTVLGLFATFFPGTCARTWWDLGSDAPLWPLSTGPSPPTRPVSLKVGDKTVTTTSVAAADAAVEETDYAVRLLMRLLGARDLSIAAAIVALDAQEKYSAVGTVILAGMGLCVADVVAIWKRRGAGMGSLFVVGVAQWALIGWGLQFWYN